MNVFQTFYTETVMAQNDSNRDQCTAAPSALGSAPERRKRMSYHVQIANHSGTNGEVQQFSFDVDADGSYLVKQPHTDFTLAAIPEGVEVTAEVSAAVGEAVVKAPPIISKPGNNKIKIEGNITNAETLTIVIKNAAGVVVVNESQALGAGAHTYTSPTLANGTYTVTITDSTSGVVFVKTVTLP